MEDGSAAPVELILVQSGALGFYQKRLFICTCFLQALTVSAFVYASQCHLDFSPPAPSIASNGQLSSQTWCDEELTSDVDAARVAAMLDSNSSLVGQLTQVATTASSANSAAESRGGVSPQRTGEETGSFARGSRSVHGRRASPLSEELIPTQNSLNEWSTTSPGEEDASSSAVPDTTESPDGSSAGRGKSGLSGDLSHEVSVSEPTEAWDFKVETATYFRYVGYDGDFGERSQEGLRFPSHAPTWSSITHDNTEAIQTTPAKAVTLVSLSSTDSAGMDTSHAGLPLTVSGSAETTNKFSRETTRTCTDKDDEDGPMYFTLTYLPVDEWLRDVDRHKLSQYSTYCQTVGAMLGAALGAMGADIAGRRRPLYVYFPLMLIAHTLSGFAVSWTMLAASRFLVGLFAGACAVVSVVFPLEFVGPEWRDACLCSCIWVAGVVLISLELLITRHWRYLAFISGGVGIPLIGTYFIASESARWLMCHQKFTDAETTLKEIISCNASTVPDFLTLFDKSRACVVTNMHNKRYTFLDLFYSLETTKWTLALTYTCLVASSVYFCLLGKVKDMTGNIYVDLSLPFVIDLPLGWSAVVVNRCLGRRWCLFLYAVASGLALMSVLVLHVTGNLTQMPSMLTGMAVFGKIGVTASLCLVFVIAVEMYPTVVRCMGVGVCAVAVTGGSLLAETFVFLEAYHYTVPFVAFGAMMASVGFAGLLFPETLYRPLPNILPCRHRTIPLQEGVRLVTNPWDVL